MIDEVVDLTAQVAARLRVHHAEDDDVDTAPRRGIDDEARRHVGADVDDTKAAGRGKHGGGEDPEFVPLARRGREEQPARTSSFE